MTQVTPLKGSWYERKAVPSSAGVKGQTGDASITMSANKFWHLSSRFKVPHFHYLYQSCRKDGSDIITTKSREICFYKSGDINIKDDSLGQPERWLWGPGIQSLAPTWQHITIYNSSSRGSSTLFWSLQDTSHAHATHTYIDTCRQNMHTHTN